MTDPRIPDYLKTKHLTLCRDNLIEYILKHVKEDCDCRVHDGKHYISIGIDKDPSVLRIPPLPNNIM